jgi:hypothetical protein
MSHVAGGSRTGTILSDQYAREYPDLIGSSYCNCGLFYRRHRRGDNIGAGGDVHVAARYRCVLLNSSIQSWSGSHERGRHDFHLSQCCFWSFSNGNLVLRHENFQGGARRVFGGWPNYRRRQDDNQTEPQETTGTAIRRMSTIAIATRINRTLPKGSSGAEWLLPAALAQSCSFRRFVFHIAIFFRS